MNFSILCGEKKEKRASQNTTLLLCGRENELKKRHEKIVTLTPSIL